MNRILSMNALLFLFVLLGGCSLHTVQQHSAYTSQSNVDPSIAISPSGELLVFSGRGSGDTDLYLMDLKTLKVSCIRKTEEAEREPFFSPDGETLVYSSFVPPGPYDFTQRKIFTCSLDGTHVKQLTGTPGTADSNPSFSHDGKYIAFERSRNENSIMDVADVYLMKNDGSDLRRLTTENYNSVLRPRFCLDDESVLVEASHNSQEALGQSIVKIELTGSRHILETFKLGQVNYSPSPSWRGAGVAFVSDFPTRYDHEIFYAKDLLNSPRPMNIRQLGEGPRCCVLSPDETSVLFLQNDTELWMVKTDGTNAHMLADSHLFDDPLHWRPIASATSGPTR